jgi:hypothetical protein
MNIHFHRVQPTGVADEAALEQFQKQWATYQKLVDADALSHKEVGTVLHDAQGHPSAVRLPRHRLRRCRPNEAGARRHQGPALSRHRPVRACARACRQQPEGRSVRVELDHRDFVEALERRPEPADAAWCGLSIHHLSTEGKLELLTAIHGSTSDMLMIYEPTLADGEDRDGYLARFRRVNRPAWPFLTKEEWEQIDHHVTTCDFPESAATWLDMGRNAGFSAARKSSAIPPASTASTATTTDLFAPYAGALRRRIRPQEEGGPVADQRCDWRAERRPPRSQKDRGHQKVFGAPSPLNSGRWPRRGNGDACPKPASYSTIIAVSVSRRSASAAGLSQRMRWMRGKRMATPDL